MRPITKLRPRVPAEIVERVAAADRLKRDEATPEDMALLRRWGIMGATGEDGVWRAVTAR